MTSLPNVGPMQSKCSRFYLGYKKCVEWAQNPKDCYPYWDDYQECIHPAKEASLSHENLFIRSIYLLGL